LVKTPAVLYKILVIGIILLFIGAVIAPTISSDTDTSTIQEYNGSLLGYVNDTSGNPIEGALVRVYFHGTYEEDYSDSTGFYHVTNIPICNCSKNSTCSKECYKTEWVLLSIAENTTYDFVLTSVNCPPDEPHIAGPTCGKPGEEYIFYFLTFDPEGDNVSYYIEWEDGTSTGWTLYVQSGVDIGFGHTWNQIDDYYVRCKAKDIHGAESDWSRQSIKIFKNEPFNFNFKLLERFLNRFPFLEVFLRVMNLLR
jgi:hypothetical protein